MDFDFIINKLESPCVFICLAGALFAVDLMFTKNIQNIIKLHYRTLLFLAPFVFLLIGIHKIYSLEINLTLTFSSIFLAILFFLLNKTQTDIAKENAIESAHKYNCHNAIEIIKLFTFENNLTSKFHTVPFMPNIYEEHIDHIFLYKKQDRGDHILLAIMEMEKSNNIMTIVQNMNIDGVKAGHSRNFLKQLNFRLLESSKEIKKLICENSDSINNKP